MGRSLSPILRQELENLEKDADSRKSAMKALKSYVKELDSKAIPLFLAKVSETKETGSSNGEYTISLYEVLARVHGPKIVPQIDNIMTTIINTLASSAGSFALHQACAKVVPAIARYGIDPTTPEDKKRHTIYSLCKPLSDSLLSSLESLSTGSALCLKALVDSDNWRFAATEMVNEVCQRVAVALDRDRPLQTNPHMGLVMSLAKHNSLVVEAYARLLIQSGLRILNAGVSEGESQKRLSSIHMVNFLMKCLDPKSIFSELELIIEEMEKCQSNQMAYVRGAAFEALQTARKILSEKGPKLEREVGSITGSNGSGSENNCRRNLWGAGDFSPGTASPESQTVNSFLGYDSFIDSPISEVSRNWQHDRRSVNRKHWRYQNGGVDISLKDGFYSEVTNGNGFENSVHEEFSDNKRDYAEGFAGFLHRSPRNGTPRSTTPSPQRSRSQINIDNVKIFTTPRKLIHSLQEANDAGSNISVKQTRRCRSPYSSEIEWSPMSKCNQNGSSHEMKPDDKKDEHLSGGGAQLHSGSESVSSTEDLSADADLQVSRDVIPEIRSEASFDVQRKRQKSVVNAVFGALLVFFAVFLCLMRIDDHDEGYLVPT